LPAVWANDEDITDEAVLASYLSQVGLDPSPALMDAKTDEIAMIRERNTRDAIAADAVGVPTYVSMANRSGAGPD
jgi:predicted DsbA family dithiol-disulfide isomerase